MTIRKYNECVNEHADGLFRFIVKNLNDEFEAENIVQNTFEKLWVRIEYIDVKRVKAYIYKIAYNEMIDVTRRNKRFLKLESASTVEAEKQEYNNVMDYVNKVIHTLPKQQKSAILLETTKGMITTVSEKLPE
ncbi:RNA polymerase sigma factor [Bacteroidia bacterium]|nr:RNA polymerase sigma factor [Bacteroidia bacterium]MDC0561824.1 RNA polymerase sigma factor [Bacteroidia bacterium]